METFFLVVGNLIALAVIAYVLSAWRAMARWMDITNRSERAYNMAAARRDLAVALGESGKDETIERARAMFAWQAENANKPRLFPWPRWTPLLLCLLWLGCASETRSLAPRLDEAPAAREDGGAAAFADADPVGAPTDSGTETPLDASADASAADAELAVDASADASAADAELAVDASADAAQPDARTGPLCSSPSPYASICESSACTEVCDWCRGFDCGVTCCDDPRYPGGEFWCVCP